MLQSFSIMYQNIRGIKSKWNSLKQIVEEKQPTITALVETHLEEQDNVLTIDGYDTIRRDRQYGQGGGMLIYYNKSIKNMLTVISPEDSSNESVTCIKIKNSRTNIKLGVVYMPQESETKREELKQIYDKLEQEIEISLRGDERILMIGDYNARIGTMIPGNEEKVTKGGRIIKHMMNKYNLYAANCSDKCSGLWTRSEKESKSVIDYAIIRKEDAKYIRSMNI